MSVGCTSDIDCASTVDVRLVTRWRRDNGRLPVCGTLVRVFLVSIFFLFADRTPNMLSTSMMHRHITLCSCEACGMRGTRRDYKGVVMEHAELFSLSRSIAMAHSVVVHS